MTQVITNLSLYDRDQYLWLEDAIAKLQVEDFQAITLFFSPNSKELSTLLVCSPTAEIRNINPVKLLNQFLRIEKSRQNLAIF